MEVAANYIDQILIFSIFALSLNLLLGYAGQVSVAHASFGAIGGYGAGYLSITHGWNLFLGAIVGAVVAGIIGAIVALPALRLSVEYLILLTLGVSSVLLGLFTTFPQLGGTYGLIGIPPASLFGYDLLKTSDWLIPLAVILVVIYGICHRLGETAYGRVLKGIRDDPEATQSLGKNVVWFKVAIFGITCAMAGLAGALLAGFNSLATPSQFSFDVSLSIFAMVIFGGTGNLAGSILGAATVILTKPLLEWAVSLAPEIASLWRLTLYGLLLVVLMRLRPQGLVPEGARLLQPATWRAGSTTEQPSEALPQHLAEEAQDWKTSAGSSGAIVAAREADWIDQPVVLEVNGLSKAFGSIVAAEDLSMVLRKGTITALVGPNGAGKTTVFNLLTGFIKPDSGSVKLNGVELIGTTPNRVANAGMVRSWQDVRVIPRLSSVQNVMLGVQEQDGERLAGLFGNPGAVRQREREVHDEAMEWLRFVGMDAFARESAGALSFGQSKLVALARVLATNADVLLLDEPASGIDRQWVDAMLGLIEKVREQGRTVCIVEHNLMVVDRLADHTYFMELGRITDQGTFTELTSSPRLAKAYFGTA
ncbi:MAG: ATP-binding cassette domain-containing protein [Ilumatobacter sp.]|uniref:branched-chain amino acid ABC transporter ATP-binding protein/permease n=1 Tax=Ilumatobacter sp. TaxID=1967498 RepID=UPI00329906AF